MACPRPKRIHFRQITKRLTRVSHGHDPLRVIRHGIAHPGHAITADLHGDAAGFFKQGVLIGCADQHLVAGAEHLQGPVGAGEFLLRGLFFR
jgi:hypothetical protein